MPALTVSVLLCTLQHTAHATHNAAHSYIDIYVLVHTAAHSNINIYVLVHTAARSAHYAHCSAQLHKAISVAFEKSLVTDDDIHTYGVATVSRIDKIIGLFCRISFLL